MSPDEVLFEQLHRWADPQPLHIITPGQLSAAQSTRPPSDELDAFDEEIRQLEERLAMRKRDREVLLARLAPIARTPPEILAKIFAFAVYDSRDAYMLETIQLVCSRWRELALQAPVLWSHISFSLPIGRPSPDALPITPPATDMYSALIRRAETMLARSVDTKLCLEFTAVGAVDNMHPRFIEPEAVMPHLYRCYKINILGGWSMLPSLHEAAEHLGDALEEIVVGEENAPWTPWNPHLISPLTSPPPLLVAERTYPRLHTLIMDTLPLSCVQVANLPALRVLSLGRRAGSVPGTYSPANVGDSRGWRPAIPLGDLISFLRVHPALEDVALIALRFDVHALADVLAAQPAHSSVPALKTLAFSDMAGADIEAILASLVAPSLASLSLRMNRADATDAGFLVSALRADGEQRFPALRVLDLHRVRVQGAAMLHLVRLYRALPALTALGLAHPHEGVLSADFFDLLAAPLDAASAEPEWLLPKLACLALGGCNAYGGLDSGILRVIRARHAAQTAMLDDDGRLVWLSSSVQRLRCLRLDRCTGLSQDGVDSMRELVDVVDWRQHSWVPMPRTAWG